jgi:hypothetical protein
MIMSDPLKEIERRLFYSIGPEVRERDLDIRDSAGRPYTRAVAMCRSDNVAKTIVDLLNADAEYGAKPRPYFLTPDQAPKLNMTMAAPPENPPAVCVDVYARNYLTKLYGYLVRQAFEQDKDPTDIPSPDWEDSKPRLEYP